MKLTEILERHWQELRKYPNVLNVSSGKKFVGGKKTDVDSVIVFVSKKMAEADLKSEHRIPKEIEGIPTDVVEFSTGDYELGETSASKRSPKIQRRLGGGVIRKQ